MIFLFRPSTHSKYNMCSVLAFFHYRENFNLISFAPLLGYLMSFFQIQKAKLRQKMVFRVRKEGLLLSVSSSSSILQGAGGGNEKVMRLFLPPPPCALLEKTDEPELANKVKTIRGEDAHARTHTTHKKKKNEMCSYTPGRLIVSISTSFLPSNMSPVWFPPSHSAREAQDGGSAGDWNLSTFGNLTLI